MKVLIKVDCLLGIGHAVRAAVLARAFARENVDVLLVTGQGVPSPGVYAGCPHVIALPGLRARDARCSDLVDTTGRPIDAAWRWRRQKSLQQITQAFSPDIVVTEHFPFGRRCLHFEMIPFLEQLRQRRPQPLICASIRDVLVRKAHRSREQEMADIFLTYYDRLLVHSDPAVIRLEESFPFVASLVPFLAYTGFLHQNGEEACPALPLAQRQTILVSAGGGRAGFGFLKKTVEALGQTPEAGRYPWHILVSPAVSETEFKTFQAYVTTQHQKGALVTRNVPAFQALLRDARLSISQAGYNTVMDVLETQTPAVMIPAALHANEQRTRTRLLSRAGRICTLDEADLTPARFSAVISRALEMPVQDFPVLWDRGARSVAWMLNWANGK